MVGRIHRYSLKILLKKTARSTFLLVDCLGITHKKSAELFANSLADIRTDAIAWSDGISFLHRTDSIARSDGISGLHLDQKMKMIWYQSKRISIEIGRQILIIFFKKIVIVFSLKKIFSLLFPRLKI